MNVAESPSDRVACENFICCREMSTVLWEAGYITWRTVKPFVACQGDVELQPPLVRAEANGLM